MQNISSTPELPKPPHPPELSAVSSHQGACSLGVKNRISCVHWLLVLVFADLSLVRISCRWFRVWVAVG